ncbi:hypothetical protein V6N11_055417 [Hibiscus sabdariffa]|uniref:Uncharacterized protein n=1 Tax=Hibiscus sabdariffa TaxID=183260 RepID=A0ABR2PFA0_9ROSI
MEMGGAGKKDTQHNSNGFLEIFFLSFFRNRWKKLDVCDAIYIPNVLDVAGDKEHRKLWPQNVVDILHCSNVPCPAPNRK